MQLLDRLKWFNESICHLKLLESQTNHSNLFFFLRRLGQENLRKLRCPDFSESPNNEQKETKTKRDTNFTV